MLPQTKKNLPQTKKMLLRGKKNMPQGKKMLTRSKKNLPRVKKMLPKTEKNTRKKPHPSHSTKTLSPTSPPSRRAALLPTMASSR